MSTQEKAASRSPENDRFLAFLKRAHDEVAAWPEWKQNLLGWHYSKRQEREKGRQSP